MKFTTLIAGFLLVFIAACSAPSMVAEKTVSRSNVPVQNIDGGTSYVTGFVFEGVRYIAEGAVTSGDYVIPSDYITVPASVNLYNADEVTAWARANVDAGFIATPRLESRCSANPADPDNTEISTCFQDNGVPGVSGPNLVRENLVPQHGATW